MPIRIIPMVSFIYLEMMRNMPAQHAEERQASELAPNNTKVLSFCDYPQN